MLSPDANWIMSKVYHQALAFPKRGCAYPKEGPEFWIIFPSPGLATITRVNLRILNAGLMGGGSLIAPLTGRRCVCVACLQDSSGLCESYVTRHVCNNPRSKRACERKLSLNSNCIVYLQIRRIDSRTGVNSRVCVSLFGFVCKEDEAG